MQQLEWIDNNIAIGVGQPPRVKLKNGLSYRVRRLEQQPCAAVNIAAISQALKKVGLNVIVVTDDSSALPAGWPSQRRGVQPGGNECLLWALVQWTAADMEIEVAGFTIDIVEANTGKVLFEDPGLVKRVAGTAAKLPPGGPLGPRPPIPAILDPALPGLGFPVPALPGVDGPRAQQAIQAAQKVALACPHLAVPNGPLFHALTSFGVFAAAAVVAGVDTQANLDALFEQLDELCPTWRAARPGSPPPTPVPGPPSPQLADLFSKIALALASGILTGLPDLARQATEAGLPQLAQQISDFLKRQAGAPPVEPPPNGGPPVAVKKKKKSVVPLVIGGVALVGAVILIGAAS